MARMPQIPQIDYGNRPDGQVPKASLPPVGETGAVAREGASVLENLAGMQARTEEGQQKALQDALDAKQKIVDTVTATRSAGDFEESLRNQADKIQQDMVDTPEKAPGEFLTRARQMADSAINAAPNSAVALSLAQKTDAHISALMSGMHTWAQLRMTQKAKSDLTVMVNQATRGAEDQLSPRMLEQYANSRWEDLKPSVDGLHSDSKDFQGKLFNEMAKSWVVANGAKDPVGTMKALDAGYAGSVKGGFLVDHLTSEDRDKLRKEVTASFEGMGKHKQMQVLKEGVDLTGNAYDLFRSGELTSGSVYSIQKSLEQKKMAVSLDPNMSDDARKAQLASIDVQSKTLQALDMANRKQSGFDAADDEGARTKLLADYDKLFKQDKGAAGKDLSSVLQFRHDLAVAYAGNQISRASFGTMDKGLSLALPKALVKESGNTGTWFGVGMPWRSARQSGDAALNDYLDAKSGVLGTLSDKQQNNARLFYMEQINDATENGRNIDEASAQLMARRAAYYAAGKKMPGGGSR